MTEPRGINAEEASSFACVYPGCEKGPQPERGGHHIERVNPKGEPFEGACSEHYAAVVNDQEPDHAS